MVVENEFRGDLDGYSVYRVLNKRNSICKALATTMASFEVIGETLEVALPAISRIFASKLNSRVDIVSQSLMQLLRDECDRPTLEDYRKAAWVMAANIDLLQTDTPLGKFTLPIEKEWVPVRVIGVMPGVHPYFKTWGNWLTFYCLGGRPTTTTFRSFHDSRKGRNFLYYTMFELSKTKRLEHHLEFMWMQSWVLLDPKKCKPREGIVFNRVGMTETMRNANRKLFHARQSPCPAGHDWTCHECTKGVYDCDNAVHENTYVLRHCTHCNIGDAQFEPEEEGTMCLTCREAIRISEERAKLPKPKEETEDEWV